MTPSEEAIEQPLRAQVCLRAYLLAKPENAAVIEFYRRVGWSEPPVSILAKNLD